MDKRIFKSNTIFENVPCGFLKRHKLFNDNTFVYCVDDNIVKANSTKLVDITNSGNEPLDEMVNITVLQCNLFCP